mmetsp:Transcript_11981/g.25509  ORF Transcript_11981/g.25509 Transcript_11981/m.25509 type:complete len:95 (+) Transcript_11981:1039-1323(+)
MPPWIGESNLLTSLPFLLAQYLASCNFPGFVDQFVYEWRVLVCEAWDDSSLSLNPLARRADHDSLTMAPGFDNTHHALVLLSMALMKSRSAVSF